MQYNPLRTGVFGMNTLLESIKKYFALSNIISKTVEVNLNTLLQEVFEKVKTPTASFKLAGALAAVEVNKRHFIKVF